MLIIALILTKFYFLSKFQLKIGTRQEIPVLKKPESFINFPFLKAELASMLHDTFIVRSHVNYTLNIVFTVFDEIFFLHVY